MGVGIECLLGCVQFVYGIGGRGEFMGISNDKGYFVFFTLLVVSDGLKVDVVYNYEVFGLVAIIMGYNGEVVEVS